MADGLNHRIGFRPVQIITASILLQNHFHRKITPQKFPDINFIPFDSIQKFKLKRKRKYAPFISQRKQIFLVF